VKVVVAPDKFRGSLTAPQAARAIRAGLVRVQPEADVHLVPVADGGDGTVEAAVSAGFTPARVTVTGPTGEPVSAVFALRDHTAVIEMAEASGLAKLPGRPTPHTALTATSFGTGQLITAALDAGATRIVLGVGGSASTDAGAGLATALGVRLLTTSGKAIEPGGRGLLELDSIDAHGLDPRLCTTELILATDVDNPLIGEYGAAHVYAPQKGADPVTVRLLDQALGNLAAVITTTTGQNITGQNISSMAGAGAAGGIAATAVPLLGATLRSGSDILLQMLGLPDVIAGAALVITGEGSLDAQSLRGKAPHGVAQLGAAHSVPVVAIAGRITVSQRALTAAGIRQAYSIAAIETDPARQMSHAAELVAQLSEQLAHQWLEAGPERHQATTSSGHAHDR
jgi:glycerate kinase